jgi:hypothetical protein
MKAAERFAEAFSAVLILRLNGRSPGLAAVCAGNWRYGLA